MLDLISQAVSEGIFETLKSKPKISALKIACMFRESELYYGGLQSAHNHLKKSDITLFSIANKPMLKVTKDEMVKVIPRMFIES